MDESSPRQRVALTSLVCSILAWVGAALMYFGSGIWPHFFFSNQTGTVGWFALPLLLLIVLTVVLCFSGLVGGTIALVVLRRGQPASGPDRTQRALVAWMAVVLGFLLPAVALWLFRGVPFVTELGFASVVVGLTVVLFLSWRRWSRARKGVILPSTASDVEVGQRQPHLQRGQARMGPLTIVALGIAILIPSVLVLIIKSAPGGQLNYEILLVGPVYFICLGCDAALLFFAIQLDRQAGRPSLTVASAAAIFFSLAIVGLGLMCGGHMG
jgi:hypothetical protein